MIGVISRAAGPRLGRANRINGPRHPPRSNGWVGLQPGRPALPHKVAGYQPDGAPAFCSSSHVFSGAK
jgi:hypothetical protein